MARILLGVTAGIAAYKACDLIRGFQKLGHEVTVVMTAGAREFITPLTLRTLSKNPVYDDIFFESKNPDSPVTHIGLATSFDVILVAPATADIIGKAANGLATDLLSTVILAAECPVVYAPSMNTRMWRHPAVKENIKKIISRGSHVIEPETGSLACGEYGEGRMAEPETVIEQTLLAIKKKTAPQEDVSLKGKTILITSGATREYLDDVRFISNPSTGKTGYYLAQAALKMGAKKVIFITGESGMAPENSCYCRVIKTISASDMFDAVMDNIGTADIMIGAAAVGDFAPKRVKGKTDRKSGLKLELKPTKDIIAAAAKKNKNCFFVGYSAEAGPSKKRAVEKMNEKGIDMIVFNDITRPNAGFASDENCITIYLRGKNKPVFEGCGLKQELAAKVLSCAAGEIK